MRRRNNPILTLLIVLFCLVLLALAGYMLVQVLPQKAPQEVTTIETNSVFESDGRPSNRTASRRMRASSRPALTQRPSRNRTRLPHRIHPKRLPKMVSSPRTRTNARGRL